MKPAPIGAPRQQQFYTGSTLKQFDVMTNLRQQMVSLCLPFGAHLAYSVPLAQSAKRDLPKMDAKNHAG